MSRLSVPFRNTILAIATTLTIVTAQPYMAQAFNLGQLLPRILPGIIETIQISTIGPKQEMDLGKETNAQLTKKQMPILKDTNLTNYINDIGQRIARYNKRQDITYTFQVVDDNNINAAATMGGYVYINKGTIIAADNEAQLASVIAHEIAHIEGRHTIEQAKNSSLARTGAAALKLDRSTLIGLASQFALDMPRSRRFEFNADQDGLRMLREAGYDQQGMVDFMKKLASTGGRSLPKWLSTHPNPSDRVVALEKLMKNNPNIGTDGTDTVAYARRVGKTAPKTATPAPTPAPTVKPSPAPTTPVPTTPVPTTPVPTTPDGGIVVPTE